MNCEKLINSGGTADSVPAGSGKSTPDKPIKKGVRWSKTPGTSDGGTVDEAGTSNPSGMRGCRFNTGIYREFEKSEEPV
jgi:hypothetical protein